MFGDGEIGAHRALGRYTVERQGAGGERTDQWVVGGSGQHRDGVEPGQRQGPCDVDPLTAWLGGHRRNSVYRTASEGARQGDRAVDARVGSDGDDHATTTSTPLLVSSSRSAALISESVIRVSTLEIGAKLTKSSRPTFDESAATTT